MAWKTPNGCQLEPGDEVVWITENGSYDWGFTGFVYRCLPVNDTDDGEIEISWIDNDGPLKFRNPRTDEMRPRIWYYPQWVEKLDSISALDRLAREA